MNRRTAMLSAGAVLVCGWKREAGAQSAAAAPLAMTVHKDPGCTCCDKWAEHLRQAGFAVRVIEDGSVTPTKERVGVPPALRSCHTGEVGGYFVEGHVPAADVLRLLRERPRAKGLAVPGMPPGSPGMEVEGIKPSFEVMLVGRDGSTSVFARHGA